MNDASPRFRQDLEASVTEAEGVPCVDVRDPRSGTSFRFYDFEYQLALQFNGQPLRDVTTWASQAYGVDLTVEGMNEFAGRLSELGFLESSSGAPDERGATPAGGTKATDLESAEAEWMSAEGAKTASFVPEPGMLDSAADLTPVAPELPHLDEEADAAAGSVDVTTDEPTPPPAEPKPAEAPTPPRLFDIPSPAPSVLPPIKSPPPPAAKPASSWAMDLEGGLRPETDSPGPAASAKSNGAEMMTPPPALTPPPLLTPPPMLTPSPVAKAPAATPAGVAAKLGAPPSPAGLSERRQPPAPEAVLMTAFSEDAAGAGKPKRRTGRVIVLLILLLAIVGIVYLQRSRENARVPEAVRVRVLSPKPAAIYRWFPGSGTVTDHEAHTLAFTSAGTLAELLPPGTAFGAGDILGKLRGAQPIEALVGRQRARVAFYQQMRESMRAANNAAELRQAEIKLADKQRLVDDSMASLAKLVLRASEPGEIVETLAKVGTPVRAGVPLMRVKGRMLHGAFALSEAEIASVGKIGFCRVEVVGLGPRASNAHAPAAAVDTAADVGSPEAQAAPRFIDCEFEKSATGDNKLHVTLPDNLGLVPGQPLRLARHRYDAVFPLPGAAIVTEGDKGRSVWIASPAGTAERRAVTVVDFEPVVDGARVYLPEDALVAEGLRVGDEVIVGAPADLRPGAPIVVER
jgi:multidrug efflux pump subunit AcrA (membrane-fusion protein)